ncbi:hypothetical protein N309_09479, partial [Tinamus guttatus]
HRDLWAQLHRNTDSSYRQTHRLIHKYGRRSPGLYPGGDSNTCANPALRLVLTSQLHKYALNNFQFI